MCLTYDGDKGAFHFEYSRLRSGGSDDNRGSLLSAANLFGYRVTDVDREFQFMQSLFRHGFEFTAEQAASLQIIEGTKIGWCMKDWYRCGCCGKEFEYVTSDYTSQSCNL
jgi:hypothetical protein